MDLKIQTLQKIVKQVLAEEKSLEFLRVEIARELGKTSVTEGKIEFIAESANNQIDIMEHSGQAGDMNFRTSVMMKFAGHSDPQVRKLVARTVPIRLLGTLKYDKNASVRAAVARRLPAASIKEVRKRYPNDNVLRTIYSEKRVTEAGIPQPKVVNEPFDMYGEKLGDAGKQQYADMELSDTWYAERAKSFLRDFGQNIEYQWEEIIAKRYCSSIKATTGVEIDEQKLYKAIKDAIEAKEDLKLKRDALQETVSYLNGSQSIMPVISEEIDPVRSLYESDVSPQQYIDEANKLFRIQESQLPSSIRKYRVGEIKNNGVLTTPIPVIGRLPHGNGLRSLDEQALDKYTRHWNNRQAMQGEPIKIVWGPHPTDDGKIGFSASLK
jgi:hypothetical protein